MKKLITTLLLTLMAIVVAVGQDLTVKTFECRTTDLEAKVRPVKDLNGDDCALIRVYIAAEGCVFDGNIVGEPRVVQGEYRIYVPAGTRRLKISHPEFLFLPLNYEFQLKIESNKTYELRLQLPERSGPIKQALESQFLVMKVTPATATVLVDNMVRTLDEKGGLFIELPFGEHSYQVVAPMYHTRRGSFTISGASRTELQVDLKPAFGTLKVSSTPSGATVMVDGEVKGTTPCTLSVESGERFVQVMSEGYIAYGENVTISDGVTLPLPVNLKANFAQVTLQAPHANSEIWLGGKLLSTGSWTGRLNAGTYSVEVRTEGYESSTQNIEVLAGTPKSYTLTGGHAVYGVLKVTSQPMGATVKLDGKVLGTTPFMSNEVLTGNRIVEVEHKGYTPYKKEVSIQRATPCTVEATLSNEPVYKVGDLYSRGNKVGIIFEVDATGKKGKIVDLGFYGPGEQDNREDALKIIKKTKGDDWRLPTINELKAMYTHKSLLESVLPELYRNHNKSENENAWLSSYYNRNESSHYRSVLLNSGKIVKEYYALARICMVTSFDVTTEPATKSEFKRTYKVGEAYAENGIRGIVYEYNQSTGAVKIVAPYMTESEKESHSIVDPRWRLPSEVEIKKIHRAGIYNNPSGVYLSDGYRYNPSRAQYLNFRLLFVATIAPNPYLDEEASINGEFVYKTTQAPYKVGDLYNEEGLFGVVFRANGAGDKVWLVGMNKRHNPGLGGLPSKEEQSILKSKMSTINQTLELFEGSEPMTEKNLSNYMVTRNFEYDYELGDYYNENGMEGVVIATNVWHDSGLIVSLKQAGPMMWYTGSKFPKFKGGSTDEEMIRSEKDWQSRFPLYNFASQLPTGWFVPGKAHKEEAKLFAEILNFATDKINKTLQQHGGDALATDRGYWQLDGVLFMYSKSEVAYAIDLRYSNGRQKYTIDEFRTPNTSLYVRPLAKFRSTKPLEKRTTGLKVPNLSALKR